MTLRALPALLVVLAATPATARPVAHASKVRAIEGITEYQLDNGLQILVMPDPTVSTVTVDVVYHVGSRNEGYGETGMAHLLEHMMFKGSPRHRNVWKLLEDKGAQGNGHTTFDRTHYFETLSASQDNVDWAIDLGADLMANASISDDDLHSEFSVVRNEFEKWESAPDWIIYERVAQAAFAWHGYGRTVAGARSDIERVPGAALRAFHDRYYQPDNATLVVAGKLDVPATLATIERTFGVIPRPARVLPSTYTVEPVQDGERRVTLERSGDVDLVQIAYHSVSGASADFSAVEAAATMLAGEPSGRLYTKLVATKLAASITADVDQRHDPGLVRFTATVRDPKNVDQVEKIMEREIESFGATSADAASAKELERWRVRRLKQLELGMADTSEFAIQLADWIAIGDWRTVFAFREQVRKVTPADVSRVATSYFLPTNRTVGRFVPTAAPVRAPLTETASAQDAVRGVKEGGTIDEGEAFAATLDNIDAHTARGELKGGIHTALLTKKTRHAKVHLELHLHWGDEKSLHGRVIAGELLGSLMGRGTKHKSYQDLQDAEAQLMAYISITSDVSGLTLSIDTVRDQLGPAFGLATEMLTEPAFAAKEVEQVRQSWLASLEQSLQDPETVASQAYNQTVWPRPKGDPRRTRVIAETIELAKKVTAADVVHFYQDFAGAGHGELVVVGDFDPAAITGQVEKLATTWQSKAAYTRLGYQAFGVPGGRTTIPLVDKENAAVYVGHDLTLRDSDPDYPALLMANQVLGGDSGARLWMRIREKEGLSYEVSSWASGGAVDASGDFGTWAIVAPQNLAAAEAALVDEIRRLATGSITPAELARAKDVWARERDTSLSDDRWVASLLQGQLYVGRGMAYSKDLRAKIRALTVADVERAAKKYIAPDRLVIVEAVDRAKVAAPAAAPVAPVAPTR